MNFKNMNLNDHLFKSSRYNWGSTYTNLMEITNQKRAIYKNQKERKSSPLQKSHQITMGKRKMNKEKKTGKTRNKRAIRTLFFSC